jgi:hypothetical protein
MKDKNIKHLIDKYETGYSSLDEEKTILTSVEEPDSELNPWFKFVKRKKTQSPEQFNEELWKKFEPKTNSTRKLLIGTISAAASVLLVLSLYFNNSDSQQKMSYEEKAALLNEAIEMASNQEDKIVNQDIIYEDNTIIIYIKQN